MPYSDNASYIPAMNSFAAHWAQVDAALPLPLTVGMPGGGVVGLAGFTGLRGELDGWNAAVGGHLADRAMASGEIRLRKAALLRRLNEFNGFLDAYWGGTVFMAVRQEVPSMRDGRGVFTGALRNTISLWEKINLAPAPAGMALPLALADGTDAAAFRAEADALYAAYDAEAVAVLEAVLARAGRDAAKAAVRAVTVAYRKAVPATCAGLPELAATLPAYSPPRGHTPKPVAAQAVFLPPDSAEITYAASAEAALAAYELRGNPGAKYDPRDAVVIAANGPGDARGFITGYGLGSPGAQVSYKVFVVLTSGNRSGSKAMAVRRPPG